MKNVSRESEAYDTIPRNAIVEVGVKKWRVEIRDEYGESPR